MGMDPSEPPPLPAIGRPTRAAGTDDDPMGDEERPMDAKMAAQPKPDPQGLAVGPASQAASLS
jgi:hypothetical protein